MRPRPLIKWLGILLLLVFILVGLQQIFLPPEGGSTSTPFIIFGLLAYLGILYGIWLPYKTRRIYSQQKTLQEPYEAEITKEEFLSTNSLGNTRIKWTDFHKYKMGKTMVLVYQSDVAFNMFPKRWFSEDEFRELIGILERALGKPGT